MNENRFVAVGRIECVFDTPRGLTLVIGGPGPAKGKVAVELRDAALIKVVSNPSTGFVTGDIVSISGRLEFSVDTLQNVAVASPGCVSRIARAMSGNADQLRQAPVRAHLLPQPEPVSGAELFGVCQNPTGDGATDGAAHVPPLPAGFLVYMPLDAKPVGLCDIPL